MTYESVAIVLSAISDQVSYVICKMSFGRRIELMKQVRELASRVDFLRAGTTDSEQMEAGILAAEIDRTYLKWGLREIRGLDINGQPATPLLLMSEGPENLCVEALAAVKQECGLSEEERKN